MYRTILFDLDGTLTDPGVGITNSVAYALEKFGICVEEKRTLNPFVGPPLLDSFRRFFGFSEHDALLAIDYYREYFRSRGIFENEVYPGVPELLAALRAHGCRILLASSKPEEFCRRILDHFDLAKFFDFAGDHMKIIRTFSYLEKRSDYLFYLSIPTLIVRNENSHR